MFNSRTIKFRIVQHGQNDFRPEVKIFFWWKSLGEVYDGLTYGETFPTLEQAESAIAKEIEKMVAPRVVREFNIILTIGD